MNIHRECPLGVNIDVCGRISNMFSKNGKYWLIIKNSVNNIFCVEENGYCEQINTKRQYRKITYDCTRNQFYALALYGGEYIYILDCQFCEIGRFRIYNPTPNCEIRDLYYDAKQDLIWVLSMQHIFRLNINGDFLGYWLTLPHGFQGDSICVFKNYVFLAQHRDKCSYLISYNRSGTFLERLCLGDEYTVKGIDSSTRNNVFHINVFTVKDHCYPVMLYILLEQLRYPVACYDKEPKEVCATKDGAPEDTITIEYGSELNDMQLSCFVEENSPHIEIT